MPRNVPEWIALLGAEVRLRMDETIPEAHALRVAELLEEIPIMARRGRERRTTSARPIRFQRPPLRS